MMASIHELTINAGNAAWRLWQALPEPKLDYVQWYYDVREQSISEALEGVMRGSNTTNNQTERGKL